MKVADTRTEQRLNDDSTFNATLYFPCKGPDIPKLSISQHTVHHQAYLHIDYNPNEFIKHSSDRHQLK